jgi:hypothetical protein
MRADTQNHLLKAMFYLLIAAAAVPGTARTGFAQAIEPDPPSRPLEPLKGKEGVKQSVVR